MKVCVISYVWSKQAISASCGGSKASLVRFHNKKLLLSPLVNKVPIAINLWEATEGTE